MTLNRTYLNDPYEYMSQDPCDYCRHECEEKGGICPFRSKQTEEKKSDEND